MSSNSTFVITIEEITTYMAFYVNSMTVIIGTIGGICNLITFTAPELRQNACVFYLLCAAVFQLISILTAIPTRMAVDNFGSKLEMQSIIFCKIRYYLMLTTPALSTFYTLLAIIDRCLATSSSVGLRAWSQIKVAHRLSAVVLIVVPIAGIHLLIFYQIYNNSCQVPPNTAYTIFFAIYIVILISVLPHTLMLIFCFVTFCNIRKIKRRVLPNNPHHKQSKRFELQLYIIVVLQVFITTVVTIIRMGSYSYIVLTSGNTHKTAEEKAIVNMFFDLGIAFYFFSYAISFFVSTLTSKFFRDIFWKRLLSFYRYCQTLIVQ